LSLRIVFRAVTPFRLLYPEDGGNTPHRSSLTCQNTAVFIITAKRTSDTAQDINVCVLREGSTSFVYVCLAWSRDSSVGTATRYGLDGPGIESRWGRDFPHLSRPALRLTQPPVQWIPCLSRGQSGRGVALTSHPI